MDPLRAILRKGNKDNNTLQSRKRVLLSGRKRPEVKARESHVWQSPPRRAACAYIHFADMDYLRSLGTAAVSSIVQKSGLNLPFSLGRKYPPLDALNIWTLYDATKRVFTFRSTFASILTPI